jgi:uncharacterized protein YndB with AHSA1/START domain
MIADIVHEATYPHPPDLVWKAISTHEGLSAWLMMNDLREATPGHAFRFTDRPRPFWDGVCACEIAEAEPGKRLAITWATTQERPSRVSWTLTPTPSGGTHLSLRHTGLNGVMGWLMKKGMDEGWRRMMTVSIPFVLDRLAAGSFPAREEVAAAVKARRAAG